MKLPEFSRFIPFPDGFRRCKGLKQKKRKEIINISTVCDMRFEKHEKTVTQQLQSMESSDLMQIIMMCKYDDYFLVPPFN